MFGFSWVPALLVRWRSNPGACVALGVDEGLPMVVLQLAVMEVGDAHPGKIGRPGRFGMFRAHRV